MLPALCAILDSFVFDAQVRQRLTGLNISFFVLDETAVAPPTNALTANNLSARLGMCGTHFAPYWLEFGLLDGGGYWRRAWAVTQHERYRLRAQLEAIAAALLGLSANDIGWILRGCDLPIGTTRNPEVGLDPKGFWRIDKDRMPEHRLPVLALLAFLDLEAKIKEQGGDVARGIGAFCAQNDGDGWMLPETLRLADYGLGHDDRAREHQPVRECFGPRFLDWQLRQSAEESWRECRLHARNLLGEEGYRELLNEIEAAGDSERSQAAKTDGGRVRSKPPGQGRLL